MKTVFEITGQLLHLYGLEYLSMFVNSIKTCLRVRGEEI